MWQPSDRIFLFGFSRGAYTVRCLAAVLSFCGVPTTMADGQTPMFRDEGSTRKIASEAVRGVYQHVGSPKDKAYLEQRKALALRFRRKYGSDADGAPNINAYFVGVFDTVAALGSYLLSGALVIVLAAIIALVSYAQSFFLFPFHFASWLLVVLSIIIAVLWYVVTHLQYAIGLPGYSFWQTLHFTAPRMTFYDLHLDNRVWYARHAVSIDENRADFARVPWGSSQNKGPPRPDSYPIGSTKSGLPGCIPMLAEATPRTSQGYRISPWTGWSMPRKTFPTPTRRTATELKSIEAYST